MSRDNREVAAVFEGIAELLELQGANRFRIRAYRNAARMLRELPEPVSGWVDRGQDLDALPGIGPDLAGKIAEVVHTGSCALLDRLRAETPPDLALMMQLPLLGPQRVHALHEELGVQTLQQLHDAARAGRVAALHGFGERLQRQIVEATSARLAQPARWPADAARPWAERLLAFLRAMPAVQRAEVAGSLRRGSATVGDIDLVVQSDAGSQVIRAFVGHPDVKSVRSAGRTQASVVLGCGLQADLRVVPAASFGAAWVYLTGPKAHNLRLRQRALRRGLKLNEYGVFRGDQRLAGAAEADVYAALGLTWPAPAERNGGGARAAAGSARPARAPLSG